jgi:hypothetical protein
LTIKFRIEDGKGSGNVAEVDENHSLHVTNIGIPPRIKNKVLKPFTSFFENSLGSTDMRVDGSTNNVDFFIQASTEGDRYIQTLAFTISDAGAQLNEFGNLSALTNGCELIYQDDQVGNVILADNLKTNFDFVQLCNFEPTFGTGTAAFLASNVSGTSEAYIPILDLTDVFGLPYGLILPQGSNKKIILRIKDNVTGIDRFDINAFGFDRIDL